jgi:long-chain fatty acid transport protein
VSVSGALKYLTVNPVVALRVLPSLSVGAGVMVNYAKIEMSQGLGRYQFPSTNFFNYNGEGWSVGYNLGVLWQQHEKISLGLSFRSSAKVTTEGHTDFELQPVIQHNFRSAQAEFNFPLTAVGGISYRPTPKWNLEFDANFTDWNSFGTVNLHQASPPPPLRTEVPVKLDWQGSWIYEFGATRYFDNGWHISGGYALNENSVPNNYYTPLAADMDRDFFSIGAGHKGKTFDFDLAYQLGYGPPQTVTGSQPSSTPGRSAGQSANGTYGFNSSALMLTIGMHF